MFQRILLAIDNSEHCREATAAAERLARDSGGAVVVFHGREKLVVDGAGEAGMDIESPQEAQVATALPTSSSKRALTRARRRVASGRKRSPTVPAPTQPGFRRRP